MQQDVKLVRDVSPYIRKDWSSRRVMLDVLIALLPVVVFAIFRWGHHALIRMLVAVAVAILTEALLFPLSQKEDRRAEGKWKKFLSRYEKFTWLNVFTSAITGLILALQVPARLNVYVVVMGTIFAIAIGKMVFGGTGNNIFNPAVLGRVFIALAFGSFFTGAYPGGDIILAGATPLQAVNSYTLPQILERYYLIDLFMGNIPGSMGEVSVLAISLGAIYLAVRRVADWKTMLGILIPAALFALLAGLAYDPSMAIKFMLFHLFSGGLVFGAVFIATDPVTSPLHVTSKLLYGLLIAGLATLIRLFSGMMPEGVAFSVLFMNMLVPTFDRIKAFKNRFTWQFGVTYGVSLLALIVIIYFGAGGGF